jgi:hypothetical protein
VKVEKMAKNGQKGQNSQPLSPKARFFFTRCSARRTELDSACNTNPDESCSKPLLTLNPKQWLLARQASLNGDKRVFSIVLE